MTQEEHAGWNRRRWAARSDFPAIAKLLAVASACRRDHVPNYISHIGMLNRSTGKSRNFIGIKGSAQASFSIEIKIDQDVAARAQLEARWVVDPYDRNIGYRVHLPETLSADDLRMLEPFIQRSYRDWTKRHPERT